MDSPPQRALGDSNLTRFVGIEPPESRFFGDLVTDRGPVTVLHRERVDRVSAALERSLGRDLKNLYLEMLLLAAESYRSPELLL
jgi:hypothetical protein